MKKWLFIFIAIVATSSDTKAQLSEGAIAPDFTFTDINGQPHHLYDYLDKGKYVAIDVFATWCGPCWDYHITRVMDSIYTLHDIAGDNTWRVLEMDMDDRTDIASLDGTGEHTWGNWLTGTLNPIINPPAGAELEEFVRTYHIRYIPQLMLICPDRQVIINTINAGDRATVATWEYAAAIGCASLPPAHLNNIDAGHRLNIYPNPARAFITIDFLIDTAATVTLIVSNIVGQALEKKRSIAFSQARRHSATMSPIYWPACTSFHFLTTTTGL